MNQKDKTNYKSQLRNVETNQREGIEMIQHFNTTQKSKWKAKNKSLYREGIMSNLKDKLSTEWKTCYDYKQR